MAQFDLTTSLADAAFNAEKKRRKYDPKTGYYIDPLTGVAAPDVQPYDRPGFLARTFSPDAQQLIGYNKQWVDKPREARLGRNIELDKANENFAAMTPKEQDTLISGARAKSIFGADGQWSGDALMAHERGMARVAQNNADVLAEGERQRAMADVEADKNKQKFELLAAQYGLPLSEVKARLSGNELRQTIAGSENIMIPRRAEVEQAALSDKLADLVSVSPYRRANEVVRERDIEPMRMGNEAESLGLQRRAMREVIDPQIGNQSFRERKITPVINATDRSNALIGKRLSDTNLEQVDVLADTQRFTNFGNRLRSQYMGENPVTAMGKGPFGVLNNEGGMDVRIGRTPTEENINAQDIADEMGTSAGGTRYSIDGQPLPTPPNFLSAPFGNIGPQGTTTRQQIQPLISGGIPSRGVSMGALPPSEPTAPIATLGTGTVQQPSLANWSVNDIVKARQPGVRQLTPEQQAEKQVITQEFADFYRTLKPGTPAYSAAEELRVEAIADEVGLTQDFVGASDVRKSLNAKFNKMLQDPVFKARLDSLQPHQVARVYQKVREGLIERGLLKDERPELIGNRPNVNTNSPWLTERYGINLNYAPR